jgi:hypothetical protein
MQEIIREKDGLAAEVTRLQAELQDRDAGVSTMHTAVTDASQHIANRPVENAEG